MRRDRGLRPGASRQFPEARAAWRPPGRKFNSTRMNIGDSHDQLWISDAIYARRSGMNRVRGRGGNIESSQRACFAACAFPSRRRNQSVTAARGVVYWIDELSMRAANFVNAQPRAGYLCFNFAACSLDNQFVNA